MLPPSASDSRVPRRRRVLLLLAAYALVRRWTGDAETRAGPWGPRWLARLLSLAFSRLLAVASVPLVSMRPPPPPFDASRQHVVVWHPHGAYTTMAFMHCGLLSASAVPLTFYPAIAPLLFKVPLFREAALLLNARSVAGPSVAKLAAAGLNVGLQPGGIPEQVAADHRREVAVFPPKLGFVRLAMRHGLPLLPAYIFGENQAYATSEVGRRLAAAAFRSLGVPLVPVTGRWGLPWLVPRATDIHVCWGAPVEVGAPNDAPSDAEVEAVFSRYVAELRRLFDANKDDCLPAEVAARGLTIVWRGPRVVGEDAACGGGAPARPVSKL